MRCPECRKGIIYGTIRATGKKHTAAAGADRSDTTLTDCRKNLNNRI